MLESSIERKVVKWCKENGVLTTKLGGPGQRGKPDRVFWMRWGHPILMEFKRPGAAARPLQEHMMREFWNRGFFVIVIDDADKAIQLLKEHIEDAELG